MALKLRIPPFPAMTPELKAFDQRHG